MRIGAVYPQIELGGDPNALDKIGRALESMQFDHLVMYDHVLGAVHENRNPPLWGPYTQHDPFHDPFVAFGYLAGITQHLEFVTGVLVLPQRQTPLVAKQATDVDLLSNGRLCLGVGIGWNYVEYDALGQSFRTRGRRMDEQIPFLRRLWSEVEIEWQGEFDRISRANLAPRPKRRIPIYCGGISDPAYRRAAKLADGFIFADHEMAIESAWPQLKDYLAREGRPVSGFGAHSFVMGRDLKALPARDAADALQRWRDAGGTHASIVSMGRSFGDARRHIDYFAQVQDAFG